MRVSTNSADHPQFRSRIEKATNLAIVVAAVACAAAWTRYGVMTPSVSPQRTVAPQYSVGDTLASVPEIAALESKPMLLLFLSSGCNVCTESLGFYREVIEHTRRTGARVRIVAASRESHDAFANYLAINRVHPDETISIKDDSPFNLTRVPTLLLIDETRRVTATWLGRLSGTPASEVLAAVKGGG